MASKPRPVHYNCWEAVYFDHDVDELCEIESIAAELGVGPSAVSGLIDRLVAQGYVERKEDPLDRRQQLVTITDAGTATLDQMREMRAQVTLRLLKGLDDSELEAFRTSLIALSREVQHLDDAE